MIDEETKSLAGVFRALLCLKMTHQVNQRVASGGGLEEVDMAAWKIF